MYPPGRSGLGGSCALAVVTVGLGGKTKPQVGYATAMDIFIIICFFSVFCTLIEFAFINFVDVFIRRLKMKDIERAMIMKEMTQSMAAPVVDCSFFPGRGVSRGVSGAANRQMSMEEVVEDACGLGPDLELPPELVTVSIEYCRHCFTQNIHLAVQSIIQNMATNISH